MSFDAALPPWLLATLSTAASIATRVPLTWDGRSHRPELHDPETAPRSAWIVRRGSLAGMAGAYEFTAHGHGAWTGVLLAFGRPFEKERGAAESMRVRVCLGSELLWRHAVRGNGAHAAIRSVLRALTIDDGDVPGILGAVPPDARVKPSRIDLCVDHWGYGWSRRDLDYFACRQRDRGMVREHVRDEWNLPDETSSYQGARTATYYVGRRGARARFLRVYDKTEEAKVSGKLPWLEPLWAVRGREPGWRVWRAEVEHGSEYLHEHGCRTLADVAGFECSAWARYLSDVRHTADDATRLKRSDTSPVWDMLWRAGLPGPLPPQWKWTPRPVSLTTDKDRLAKQAAGCAAGLAPLFEGAGAMMPDDSNGLWMGAPTKAEARQQLLDHLAPLIEEALRNQATAAALEALNKALDERERKHLPKENPDG